MPWLTMIVPGRSVQRESGLRDRDRHRQPLIAEPDESDVERHRETSPFWTMLLAAATMASSAGRGCQPRMLRARAFDVCLALPRSGTIERNSRAKTDTSRTMMSGSTRAGTFAAASPRFS